MTRQRIKAITEIGLAVALVAALKAFATVYRLPQGGAISLEMAPIFLIAFRRGLRAGVTTGVLASFVILALEPAIYYPAQVVLDYPLAFGLVGAAGIFAPRWQRLVAEAKRAGQAGPVYRGQLTAILPGVILGSALRLASHVLSGVIFFASFAPAGQNVWVYSILYNSAYLVPSAALTAVVLWIAQPVLDALVPAGEQAVDAA